jgi:DNA-binding PadR family transcriptional regulator
LIVKVGEEERRKSYTLTIKGRSILQEHFRRMAILLGNAQLLQGD